MQPHSALSQSTILTVQVANSASILAIARAASKSTASAIHAAAALPALCRSTRHVRPGLKSPANVTFTPKSFSAPLTRCSSQDPLQPGFSAYMFSFGGHAWLHTVYPSASVSPISTWLTSSASCTDVAQATWLVFVQARYLEYSTLLL